MPLASVSRTRRGSELTGAIISDLNELDSWARRLLSILMSEILHLNLHREFFAANASKQKGIEYRKQSPHWRKRLEGRKYDAILFRNGYATDAPEMLVKFLGPRRYGRGSKAYYAIRLGRIFRMRRWSKS